MSRLSQLGVVLAGYGAAFVVSCAALYTWTLLNPSQNSQGMQAFGDAVMFVGLFGVLSLVPTGLALYFLRPLEKLWTGFSIASLAFAATGPFAAVTQWIPQAGGTTVQLLSVPRIMAAPLLGVGLLTSGFIAPTRRSRLGLLAAAGIEIVVSVYGFFRLVVLSHWLP